ncbi:MAG TPA: peptidylprolyl isomerase [Arenimonas sp.]|uniref:peptidylprolyl isomerase n=1 Tax=Arenimonas sp. TaxID=1872635 RepID=UPI002C8A8B7E|nr:peptidylprolyl isomerase [Arenimonas sp.]HMB55599.1 peptidylprolyl isomerase [Arenimonas sp.]
MNPTRRRLAALALILAGFLSFPALAQNETTALAKPADVPATAASGPRVALDTSLGRIVIELYPAKAPHTVENFLAYVREGHYNGTIFHRVIADLLIQGGAFTSDLQQKPERAPIANEANNGLSNLRGTIAAARRSSEKDSAGAQFFINTVDNRQFDHSADSPAYASGYCVFGRVIDGLEIVDKIRIVPTAAKAPFDGDVPVTPVVIERAQILSE